MKDFDRATNAFENALRHNPNSVIALNAAASVARTQDRYDTAIDYFQRILNIKQDNGEVWASMGEFTEGLDLQELTRPRTLSLDEGRSSQGIYRLSTSSLSPT
jgi:tetratricopeptide (TPR) repeat protein